MCLCLSLRFLLTTEDEQNKDQDKGNEVIREIKFEIKGLKLKERWKKKLAEEVVFFHHSVRNTIIKNKKNEENTD